MTVSRHGVASKLRLCGQQRFLRICQAARTGELTQPFRAAEVNAALDIDFARVFAARGEDRFRACEMVSHSFWNEQLRSASIRSHPIGDC